jgi:hypothetical protein
VLRKSQNCDVDHDVLQVAENKALILVDKDIQREYTCLSQGEQLLSSAQAASPLHITTVRIPKQNWERLARRLPRQGDRAILIRRLVEMFLDGQVTVQVPGRKM